MSATLFSWLFSNAERRRSGRLGFGLFTPNLITTAGVDVLYISSGVIIRNAAMHLTARQSAVSQWSNTRSLFRRRFQGFCTTGTDVPEQESLFDGQMSPMNIEERINARLGFSVSTYSRAIDQHWDAPFASASTRHRGTVSTQSTITSRFSLVPVCLSKRKKNAE